METMDGLLVNPSWQDTDAALEWLRELRLEVKQLRGEVASLRVENLELRQQVGYWKSMHARAVERIKVLEQENEHLRGAHQRLRDQLFGRTSREEIVDLPEEEQTCSSCGKPLATMTDTEDSEQIESEVRAHRRVLRRRRYRKTCTCPGPHTFTAPKPAKLIPKSLLGTSVWVEVLLAKYFNQQPTERLLASWDLLGPDLSASTLNDGGQELPRVAAVGHPMVEVDSRGVS